MLLFRNMGVAIVSRRRCAKRFWTRSAPTQEPLTFAASFTFRTGRCKSCDTRVGDFRESECTDVVGIRDKVQEAISGRVGTESAIEHECQRPAHAVLWKFRKSLGDVRRSAHRRSPDKRILSADELAALFADIRAGVGQKRLASRNIAYTRIARAGFKTELGLRRPPHRRLTARRGGSEMEESFRSPTRANTEIAEAFGIAPGAVWARRRRKKYAEKRQALDSGRTSDRQPIIAGGAVVGDRQSLGSVRSHDPEGAAAMGLGSRHAKPQTDGLTVLGQMFHSLPDVPDETLVAGIVQRMLIYPGSPWNNQPEHIYNFKDSPHARRGAPSKRRLFGGEVAAIDWKVDELTC